MTLKNRQFLALVKDSAFAALEGEAPQFRLHGSMLQVYFERFPQHYELWIRPQAGLIEIGLHFEGEKEDNLRRIAVVAEAMPMIAARLGPQVDVEEWTERWTRVHETIPITELTEDRARRLGLKLARYIEVLEPVVRPLGPIQAPQRGDSQRGGAWRRRRSGARV